jgi:hypothetical protein
MAITQGSPLPDITTTATRTDTAPDYYTNYLTGLSNAATTSMGRTPAQSVAGYDPLQTQGYGALPTAAASYKPQLSAAENTAAASAAGITPERISNLMNPYTSKVVDEMARLNQQNLQRNLLPTMKAGFVGSGGLGSQRYAGALGQSLAENQANLTGAQTGALQKGYSDALTAAIQEMQNQNAVAQTQGSLAKSEQELGLTGAGALTKAGAERQAYEQSLLDAPMKNAKNASELMRGYQVPTSQTTKTVGPGSAGQYSQSPLQSVLGVLSTLGGIKTGENTSIGGELLKWLGGKASSINWGDVFGAGVTPEQLGFTQRELDAITGGNSGGGGGGGGGVTDNTDTAGYSVGV